ncbi:hypothetical protein BBAD15_g5821 [Beauveria bassiana D1-5]|uniref:Uncharacterized protein n=1 Tax=Beauveria bassiana D1-5 TaxID=1245745 RepID=A0A0A2VLS4_BEABA|nr:hypothetical protein BBAD15_g5821 [Beauveria bassiana D1-5]
MGCTRLLRAAYLLVCGLCLLLGTVRVTLAKETSNHDEFDRSSSVESLTQFPEIGDVQLRRTYMALVSMFSDASREAAKRYGVSELKMLSNDLDSHVQNVNDNTNKLHRLELKRSTVRRSSSHDDEEQESILARFLSGSLPEQGPVKPEKQSPETHSTDGSTKQTTNESGNLRRGLFGGLGKLFGGDKGDGGDGGDGGGPIADAMTKVAGKAFGKLLNATGDGLAGAGFFGGVGIGEGAAQALNLTTVQNSKTTGEQVAQQNGMTSSGLNPIVQSAAMGLTATALKAVVDSNLLQLPPLASIAASLGTGVGNGGAMGLGLTKRDVSPSLNGSGLVDSIGALGFGATQALTSSLNITGAGGLSSLLPTQGLDVGGIALGAGSGIGQGAARGLKLASAAQQPPAPKSNGDIAGIANTFAFGLSNALTDGLNVSAQSLGAMLPPIDFKSAALSVGDGIGSGAALGLKLAQNDTSGFGAPSENAAPSMADIPKIAGTLAFGVSKSLTQSLNTSGVSVSNLLPADLDIGGIVMGAGRGLGGGASAGLGLTGSADSSSGSSSSNISARALPDSLKDVAGLVEKFTFGLGNSFTDKINLTSQANNLASALPSVDLGATVSSVGSGLGLGLAKGLDLSAKAITPPERPSSIKDLPQLAGTFAFGLSDALTSQLNISGLTSGLTKNAGSLVAKFAAPVASGLGKGIGTGAAVGLGLQPESEAATSVQEASPQNGDIDAEGLTQSFAEALVSRFLANDTAGELIKSLSGGNGTDGAGSLLSNIDVPRLANGLARGLLTGAGDGVQALGGINALVSGKTVALTGPVSETKIDFDDSASGAAVGLGQGLGTSGVLTVQKLLARSMSASANPTDNSSNPQRRDLAVFDRRQDNNNNDGASPPINLTLFADASAISSLGQKGVDVLTCDGIAGLLLVASGLQKSGTVSGGTPSGNTLDTLKSLIPMGTIQVKSQGNTFAIDGTKLAENLGKPDFNVLSTLSINGSPFAKYTAFLVLHNPESSQQLDYQDEQVSSAILSLFTLIFAIAALALFFFAKPADLTPSDSVTSSAKKQRDIVTWASHACNQILLALLLPTVVTGFADLSSVTLCLTRAVLPFELAVALGMGLMSVFALGQFMSGIELFLAFMAKRAERRQRSTVKEEAADGSGRPRIASPVPQRTGTVILEKGVVVLEEEQDRGQAGGPPQLPLYI